MSKFLDKDKLLYFTQKIKEKLNALGSNAKAETNTALAVGSDTADENALEVKTDGRVIMNNGDAGLDSVLTVGGETGKNALELLVDGTLLLEDGDINVNQALKAAEGLGKGTITESTDPSQQTALAVGSDVAGENAFEVKENGDVYIKDEDGNTAKLQDLLCTIQTVSLTEAEFNALSLAEKEDPTKLYIIE